MRCADLLPLKHSWPLWQQSKSFELGIVLNSVIADALPPGDVGQIGPQHAGIWECNLADLSLTWSGGVYDIFGLPRGISVKREDVVECYTEDSRTKMEALRAYAIKHKRGFTVDVQIRTVTGVSRWMRLIGAPVYEGERAVRLHGLKLAL